MKNTPLRPEIIPLFDAKSSRDLEGEFIEELYKQRFYERQIADYFPESSAPSALIKLFLDSKKRVQKIERQMRVRRHNF